MDRSFGSSLNEPSANAMVIFLVLIIIAAVRCSILVTEACTPTIEDQIRENRRQEVIKTLTDEQKQVLGY